MVFFLQSTPDIVQCETYGGVIQLIQTLSAKHNNINGWPMILLAKTFSDLPFDPVSLYSQTQILLGENESNPGTSLIVWGGQDKKIPVRNF